MKQTNENGRSMVEMLGVLAIIGVLSVAGIAGYSMAMKKYKANEIVNIASTLYTLAEANYLLSGKTEYSLSDAGITSAPAGIGMTYYPEDDQKIVITGAGEDLCTAIKSMIGEPGHSTAEYEYTCS